MYQLQPLRLPAGWKVTRDLIELREDLLQLSHEGAHLIIDLGWYPSFDENGSYHLLLIKNQNWYSPLQKVVSKSEKEIVACIEEWVDARFWTKCDV